MARATEPSPSLSAKTIGLCTQDARRFATWWQQEHPGLKATEVTPTDAKPYRDHLLAKRYAPTTINRALMSLMLLFDTLDGTNPFRRLSMIEIVEPASRALSKTEWNAVRRCAEQAARRDHSLAFALATTTIYTRVSADDLARMMSPLKHSQRKLCRAYLLCGYEASSLTQGLTDGKPG